MLSESDIAEIKTAFPLQEFLELRGMEFTRCSGSVVASCPFHEEKTASFHVYPDHHYYCYGCGAIGDVIKFVRETQGLSFLDAVNHLRSNAPNTPITPRQAAPAKPDEPSHPLSDSRLALWHTACDRLVDDLDAQSYLMQWRGYSREIIVNAAAARLMGLWNYWDELREAFLITAPARCTTNCEPGTENWEPIPVSVHVRLAPNSHGNNTNKATWHYDPASSPEKPVKSWPFLWGNPVGARWIFVTEGQWDALALADVLGWRSPEALPPGCAIVGLRGSTGSRRFLKDFPLDRRASVICVGDHDDAGASWHDPGGLIAQLQERVKRTLCFRPQAPGCKDINDLVRKRKFPSDFLEAVRLRLQPEQKRPRRETFLKFCRQHREEETPIGRAARFVIKDKARPKGRGHPRRWRNHWTALQVDDATRNDLEAAIAKWSETAPIEELTL